MSDYDPVPGADELQHLVEAINQWGIDRNITPAGGATVMSQMSKMMEEFAEFLVTYNQLEEVCAGMQCPMEEVGKALDNYSSSDPRMMDLNEEHIELYHKLEDDFGDMMVCLIQAMRLADTDMESCLAKSWGDICNRKGWMEHGKFVKES